MAHIANWNARPVATTQTSASGVANTFTYAATAAKSHAIHGFIVDYSADPGTKTVVITATIDGTSTTVTYKIDHLVPLHTYPQWPVLPIPIVGDENTAVTVVFEALAAQTSTATVFST